LPSRRSRYGRRHDDLPQGRKVDRRFERGGCQGEQVAGGCGAMGRSRRQERRSGRPRRLRNHRENRPEDPWRCQTFAIEEGDEPTTLRHLRRGGHSSASSAATSPRGLHCLSFSRGEGAAERRMRVFTLKRKTLIRPSATFSGGEGTLQSSCARKARKGGRASNSETFRWNPAGNQSRLEKLGQQPEASLAWGRVTCPAKRRQRGQRPCDRAPKTSVVRSLRCEDLRGPRRSR